MINDKHSFAAAVVEALTRTAARSPRPRKILVPIDFSEPSMDALRHARDLAALEQAQVILLNVLESPGSFRTLDVVGQARARYGQCAGRLQELADRELGPRVARRVEVRNGNPSVEIARLARERQVNLIVVGRHPHHRAWRWVRARTASRLQKQAPCPVLLVKAGDHLN